ncbi:Antiseptic resistance protein [uncultured Roseburia sp.]|uniref:MFS transporter n=1 Tax=Brotonthovivens ammoniilytica TaxID=2981725 RepID=A0ABT2TIT1_9FIRM|nr:MFS transporter [Brotonthovivens ammoniilytica]MCU6762066.1 MFS transporter [Brotonthovivens ammoniilytica]SCI54613.1 Antiseptic resistance protein [uncultured Roseburia sp.]
MEKTSKGRVKVGIYLCAILMMGVIAVSSNIANIIGAFPEANQTTVITYLISIPCLIVIPMTIITGKLMGSIPKKTLMLIGVLLWLAGGVVPFFMDSLNMILVMRIVFGIGLGMVQSLCAALVVENFENPNERGKIMGNMTAFQMLGAIIFSLVAGNLGTISWNVAFLVHLMAIISLIATIVCIPYKKPEKVTETGEKVKFKPTGMMWVWCIAFFVYMIAGQTYSNSASSIITELKLGGSAAAGYSLALFALGGLIMGFIFGKILSACKRMTLTVGCFLLAASYLIMTFAPNLALSYVGAFVCGLAFSICMPCILTGAGSSVDQASSEMATSIATCLQNAGMAVCPYIVTPAGAALAVSAGGKLIPNQWSMIFAVIVVVILAIVFMIINMRNKKAA